MVNEIGEKKSLKALIVIIIVFKGLSEAATIICVGLLCQLSSKNPFKEPKIGIFFLFSKF